MFGDQRSRQFIEQLYLSYDKKRDTIIELFLTNNIPKEEEQLRVIVEGEEGKEGNSQPPKLDATFDQIQHQKKKRDLKSYILNEYSQILGKQSADPRFQA
mmetsp:Transcript_10451/g.17540  ORF Transcript_10451/g.17540 Transcript_10451/m.17540 type:complete len:100 (-) Transcript_10451:1071-1370(-)